MRSIDELKNNTLHLAVNDKQVKMGGAIVYNGFIEHGKFKATVFFSYDENGMEHVSVSPYNKNKIPTWEEMCMVKNMFFKKDEMAVQIHPTEDRYVHGYRGLNNVLHIWRPNDGNWEKLNHPEEWD